MDLVGRELSVAAVAAVAAVFSGIGNVYMKRACRGRCPRRRRRRLPRPYAYAVVAVITTAVSGALSALLARDARYVVMRDTERGNRTPCTRRRFN